jgi:hypothetical protein
MITDKDKSILRELAKKQAELAAMEVNRERINRIRAMHSLKPVRPPVWIDEIPWHEMDIDGELQPRCESKEGQDMERGFRRTLFKWKYFQADMVVEDTFYINKSYTSGDIGVSIREETRSTDSDNQIVSHHYEDQLDTEEKLEALKLPVIQAQPEVDKKNFEIASGILEGIMPVSMRGCWVHYSPWDDLARLRGIEPCLMDMMDRPDFVHRTMGKLTEIGLSTWSQMETQGLLDYNIQSLHSTPPYTDDLPAKDYDGGKVRMKDVWFRGKAQLFATASPAMQDEFDLHYMRGLMDKCGLSYYGCCEPLHKFIPYLRKVPNMRKIGVTPWADVKVSAEEIGGDYVIARKPNPAMVANHFNAEAVKKEIEETVELCRANNCPYEFVLKDISTVGHKPQNLIDWTNTVMSVLDHYYGR